MRKRRELRRARDQRRFRSKIPAGIGWEQTENEITIKTGFAHHGGGRAGFVSEFEEYS